MNAKFTKPLLCLLFLPIMIRAQLAPSLSQKFAPIILTRIYQVVAKVPYLAEDKQIKLGLYFKTQDSLANIAAQNGAPIVEVNKYFKTTPEGLKSTLSSFELNDYSINSDYTASKFAVAIKYRQLLSLSPLQTDSMFAFMEQAKKLRKTSGFDIKRFEYAHLTKTLEKQQLHLLLRFINKEKSVEFAKNTWLLAKQSGLTIWLDSVKTTNELDAYQNYKLSEAAYKVATGDDSDLKKAQPMPLILQRLDLLNGTSPEKELAAAIKYRNELNLNVNQINSLIDNSIRLEKWRASTVSKYPNLKVDTKSQEMKVLLPLLKTEEQYTKFLTLKNSDKAMKNAKADWDGLKAFDIAKGLDSVQINNQNQNYETSVLVNVERMSNSVTPEKADSVKMSMRINKPSLLLKLDAYKRTLPKSQVSEAIYYRKELILSDAQVDELLEAVRKVEQLKLDNKSKQLYVTTNVAHLEGSNLTSILNEIQYSQYLFFKAMDRGRANAKNDWLKLKQFGLDKGLDSAKVFMQNAGYETNMLVAVARLKNEDSQKNVFFKKQMESKKPDNLKQLDLAIKNLAANNDAKKALSW